MTLGEGDLSRLYHSRYSGSRHKSFLRTKFVSWRHAFADGWEIESLEPVRLEIRSEYKQQGAFSGEDPRGWFLIARRLA